MKTAERTQQQLDPALARDGRPLAIVLATGCVLWSTTTTVLNIAQTGGWEPRLLSLLMVVGAAALVVRATSPLRAPFTANTHLAVHVLAVLAFFLSTFGAQGTSGPSWAPWGPLTLTVLIVAMSHYRPAREIVLFGLLSACATALAALPLAASTLMPADVPPAALVVSAVLPVVATTAASSRYARIMVLNSERRRTQATLSAAALAPRLQDDVERSVYRDRVAALSSEASPFIQNILQTGTISATDRDRARDIAAQIRSAMVAEVDRTWLEAAVDRDSPRAVIRVIDDPHHCASMMSAAQRESIRPLLGALGDNGRADQLTVTIRPTDGVCRAEILAHFVTTDPTVGRRYRSELAALPLVFSDVTVSTSSRHLIVRFSFDHK